MFYSSHVSVNIELLLRDPLGFILERVQKSMIFLKDFYGA